MNNMPAIAIGMAEHYEGPIEDEAWLGIERTRVPGDRRCLWSSSQDVMNEVDVAYAQEWKFDHGIMVPLHFLTPRLDLPIIPGQHQLPGPAADSAAARLGVRRGAAPRLRRACPSGSRWSAPAASRTGRRRPIRERSTRPGIASFSSRCRATTRRRCLSYSDEATYREAGQGGFEIRTFIAAAGAAGGQGELRFYAPIPIFSVGCTVALMAVD